MKIINARVYLNGSFTEGGIEFGERIERILSKEDCEKNVDGSVDAGGMYVIPGLIDIHTHGAVEIDVSDTHTGDLQKLSEYYAHDGVTSWCPTTLTVPEEDLLKAMKLFRDFRRPQDGAKIAAVNMEGPFLSPDRAGAQNPGALHLPDADMFLRLQKASGGLVRLVSAAPELPGAMEFIKSISGDVKVSVAHTNTDYETAKTAFKAGASHVTHLYNCMPGMAHRNPGPIPAALEEGATVELITDGYHVHPSMVRLTYRLFGEKTVMISDSLRCAGMPDGDYTMGGLDITVKNGKATLRGCDTIAGSSVHLMEGLRRAVSFGIPFEKAVYSATEAPAKVIGCDDRIGSLQCGKAADLVILDGELNVKAVYIDGKSIQRKD